MRSVFLLFFISWVGLVFSQKNLEYGLFGGLVNYQGDLAEQHIQFGETKIAFGGLIRYHLHPKFNLRGGVYYGTISGDDANSPDLAFRQFKFTTNILEASMLFEYVVFGKKRFNDTGVFRNQFSPYFFAGIGYTNAAADTECYHPNCVNQSPFPEPGSRSVFLSIPIGFGLRWDVHSRLSISGEWGYRTVFSDYLDGVRIYGNPDNLDWYFFTGLTAGVHFWSVEDEFNLSNKKTPRKKTKN